MASGTVQDGLCRPYVCEFPAAKDSYPGARWTCPLCGAAYRLTRPKPPRPWRNWEAPHGHWRLTFREQLHWGHP